jgi:hypothetical protein
MSSVVYWIHHSEHTDIFTQGYVGITSRFERRMKEHSWAKNNRYLTHAIKKYGWDNLAKEVILIADEAYCLMVETKLRLQDKMGWNLVKGGGKPPVRYGNTSRLGKPAYNKGKTLSAEIKQKVSQSVKKLWQNPEYRQHMLDAHKGRASPMVGKKHSIESIEKMRLSKVGKLSGKKGIKMPQEYILKMKELAIKESWICPHCNKQGKSKGAGNRWHFDNCKENK